MPIPTSTKEQYTDTAEDYTSMFDEYVQQFKGLSEDDKLAALYAIFGGLGDERVDNPDDNKESDSSSDLYNEIAGKSQDEQLQFMRDVLSKQGNALTGKYNKLSDTTKIALWYRLGQGMDENAVVDVPSDYEMSDEAKSLVSAMNNNSFEQSYIFMRDAIIAD